MLDRETIWLAVSLVLLITAFGMLAYAGIDMAGEAESLQEAELELLIRQAVREEVRHELEGVREDYQRMTEEDRELLDRMRDWLEEWEVEIKEVTSYSPMSPDAIYGVCYSGNPNVTASGGKPVPGKTIAAGPSIPFGTRIWIEGIGVRTVNDRGGRITDRHIDLVVATKKDALLFGRQQRKVVILN